LKKKVTFCFLFYKIVVGLCINQLNKTMNYKIFLLSLNETELYQLESAILELKTEKKENYDLLFCDWVCQNKEKIPEVIYRAFVRNFKTLNKQFIQMPVSLVDLAFIYKFRGIGKIRAFQFLQMFPEFDR